MAGVGIVVAVAIPYITHFVRYNNMDSVSWALTGVGVLLFIGAVFGIWYENVSINDFIEELQQGEEETENKSLNNEEEKED